MNCDKILMACERLEVYAEKLGMSPHRGMILSEAWVIRSAAEEEGKIIPWNLRANPPTRHGQRCLCRFVYDCNPEYPVYMVLTWNGVDEHPHFNNEMPGVMRVTHWAEIDEPGGVKR